MKSFHETFKDRIDCSDGTVVLTETVYKQIQDEAIASERSEASPNAERAMTNPPTPQEQVVTAHQMLKIGGEWLAAARTWIQWNTINGDSVTWGSDAFIKGNLTIRQFEEFAATVALASTSALQKRVDQLEPIAGNYRALEQKRDELVATIAALTEEKAVLQSQVENADANLEQVKLTALASSLEKQGILSDMIRSRDERISTLEQERDRLKRELICDVCTGDGTASGAPCICGGTGKISDAMHNLRVQFFDVAKERDGLKAKVSELEYHIKFDDELATESERRLLVQIDEQSSHLTAMRQALEKISNMPWPDGESPYAVIAREAIKSAPGQERGIDYTKALRLQVHQLEKTFQYGGPSELCGALDAVSHAVEEIRMVVTDKPVASPGQELMGDKERPKSNHGARVELLQKTIRVFDQFRAACPMEDLAEEFNRRMAIYRSELQTRQAIDSAKKGEE